MKKLLMITAFLVAMVAQVNAQQQKLYSVFIYSFTKHITWPPSSGNFVVEIIGDDALYAEMSKISKVKKVGSRSMEVRKISSVSQSKNPHILFIGKSKLGEVNNYKNRFSKSTLLITDDAAKSAALHQINFIIKGGRVTFEIYESEINKTSLKMSSQLKGLGILM